jgi:mannose-6-phosphate isomerase
MTSVPSALEDASAELQAWLVEKAYPLWWEAGADLEHGGYHDALDRSGRPVALPKRARVAARQAFCFSKAPELGWDGPWRRAMDHGLDFLERAHRRADGLYRARVGGSPEAGDEHAELYDQAFVLLAWAGAADRGVATGGRAQELLGRLPRSPLGGFRELEGRELLSNPNMHLFEDFLVWTEAGGEGPWSDLAKAQARLVTTRLVDPQSGAISEIYDDDCRPAADPALREVWPGHQFEWAWLLMRFDALTSAQAASTAAALKLIELAEHAGVDPARNVAVHSLDGYLKPREAMARLWAQTERLKANLQAAEATGDGRWWANAEKSVEGLSLYLEDSGLWRDRLGAGGEFVDEPSPASSLYHIVGAILELKRIVARRG